jgi:signal peptidase I
LRRRTFIGLGVAVGLALSLLYPLGLIRSFRIPTIAMTPAIARGDHILMEGLTFLLRKPQRGDIIVFKTDGIASMNSSQRSSIYDKRVAGLPGERVHITGGKLYVNDRHVVLKNAAGEIAYHLAPSFSGMAAVTNVTVPAGHYYVLGDNSTNSYDSRFWGLVPAQSVLGRVWFCYWPPNRVGRVK